MIIHVVLHTDRPIR